MKSSKNTQKDHENNDKVTNDCTRSVEKQLTAEDLRRSINTYQENTYDDVKSN